MIARLMVVAAGVVAAVAGVAAWVKRRPGGESGTAKAPARTASEAAVSSTAEAGDDLQAIKGIGEVSMQRLSAIGVSTFAQIAAWSDDDLERIAADIKVSAERIRREDWVGQARTLSKA